MIVDLCRIVEVRSCHSGGVYTIDWNGNHDSVMISGTAIFEGDLLMKGIGWSAASNPGQMVDALNPTGSGTVEYEVGFGRLLAAYCTLFWMHAVHCVRTRVYSLLA